MFRNHDLPALVLVPIQHAQHFVRVQVGIDAHGVLIDDHKQSATALHAAEQFRYIRKMPGTVFALSISSITASANSDVPA